MEVRISLPVGVAGSGRDAELVVRDALVRNEGAFVKPLGAAFKVCVLEDRSGVELRDIHHGVVRLAIGGCREIIEEIPFSLDWGRRLLIAHVPDEP